MNTNAITTVENPLKETVELRGNDTLEIRTPISLASVNLTLMSKRQINSLIVHLEHIADEKDD